MTDIAGQRRSAPPNPSDTAPPFGREAAVSLAARNPNLQYLRGLAALAVVFYHAAGTVATLRGDGFLAKLFADPWGTHGVAVFFVLSGYLMAQLSRRDDPGRFLLDRILRIYPMMLIVVALAAIAYLTIGLWRRPDPLALTLVPAGPRDYVIGIEWTLVFEITYYVVIAALSLIGLRAWLEWLVGAWLATLAALEIAGLGPAVTLTPTLSQFFGQSANCAFLLGFLLPRIIEKTRVPSPRILCALAASVAAIGVFISDASLMRWPAALSALLLVAAALKAAPIPADGVALRFGLRLGDASYSLYLCHMPLILVSERLLSRSIPGVALWIGWTVAAVALALALGRLDLRIHDRLKRWANTLSRRIVGSIAVAGMASFAAIAVSADLDVRAMRRSEETARAAHARNQPGTWPSVIAGLDSATILGDGRLVLRGFGIDASAPDEESHIAVEQGGRLIGFDRMRRMRPQIAREAARPDLATYRFGFSVIADGRFSCANGPLSAKLILSDGRVAAIESPTLVALCPGG